MSDAPPEESTIQALGRLPSGLYILTIGQGDDATGMLVSWVQQAGFEPLSLSVVIKKGRPVSDRIESGEPFVLNVIGEGQFEYLKHFGKGFEPGEPAFDGVDTFTTESGLYGLSDAIATLECRATSGVDTGDHRLVIAEVTTGRLGNDLKPMVHLRKRGDHY